MSSTALKRKYIHPFPARMAPEIAIEALNSARPEDIILDPMVGSGTVLHQAAIKGLRTIGFDLDPLAVLISKVSTTIINTEKVLELAKMLFAEVKKLRLMDVYLPWIDDDPETKKFIHFWFGKKQINELRKIAFILFKYKEKYQDEIEIDVMRIALSRIIITKKVGASLAWDISHSRPHKVMDENDYNVIVNYELSINKVVKILVDQKSISHLGQINLGDARILKDVPNNYVDKVITSPPYLNAIDYMRGHKLSLVWLGYSISQLREIRSVSVGAEKKIVNADNPQITDSIHKKLFGRITIQPNHSSMIRRYINDSYLLMSEISRVLKKNKEAVLIVGNSTLKGNYISNSEIFRMTGKEVGLKLSSSIVREIPNSSRYLPISVNSSNSLSNRMRHEVIMTFMKN